MNKSITLFILFSFIYCSNLLAQSPPGIPYQAIARTTTGEPYANGALQARFSLHEQTATGTVSYAETHSLQTDEFGLFSTTFGAGAPVTGTFAAINWGLTTKYLQVEIDLGNGWIDMGTQQLMSVPYAFYAANGIPSGGSNGQVLTLCNGLPHWGPCPVELPQIQTIAASAVTYNSSTVGGNIINDGNAAITSKGVCYSITTNPTTANNTVLDNTNSNNFILTISNLQPSTTYYYRSYAINSAGISYGQQFTFTTESLPLNVGTSVFGGVIAYIFGPSDPGYVANETHGIIALPYDIGSGPFGCNNDIGGANGTAIGAGLQNTIDNVNSCTFCNCTNLSGIGGAAIACYNLDANGFIDWFLPSRDELNILYLNRNIIGGFLSDTYWSSTEYVNPSSGYSKFFGNGNGGGTGKTALLRVRPIRYF